MRAVLGSERTLVLLREIGADQLHALPRPLGFGRRVAPGGIARVAVQHETGPDPP